MTRKDIKKYELLSSKFRDTGIAREPKFDLGALGDLTEENRLFDFLLGVVVLVLDDATAEDPDGPAPKTEEFEYNIRRHSKRI